MRPKTPDSDRLEEGIHIRLTALEKKLLSDRSKREGYLTLSDFGRAKLLKKREIKKIEAGKEFISLVCKTDYELNKIGVNLNQIAKKININDIYQFTSSDREVFNQVLKELKNCFSVLQKYADTIDQSWLGRF
jgi:hypothetical protein